jgi:hypothetical protein
MFLGKSSVVGRGGAGKTRIIVELANRLANNKYSWDEEENIAGTLTVTLYSIDITLNNYTAKVILAGNPGQQSLETVRVIAARTGTEYKALILVTDGTA